MTEKQKLFVTEYLKDLNATRSAKAVGYSEKTAHNRGSKLLQNEEVKAFIESELERIKSKNIADTEEIMEYLTSVMRGENLSEIVVVEGSGDGRSSAKRMEKAPDEKERLKAAELLGKRFGIFTDKVDVKGAIPIVICDNLQDDFEEEVGNSQGEDDG